MCRSIRILLLLAIFLLPTKISWGRAGGGCFPAGTLILYADGSQHPIESVKVGDLLQSYVTDQEFTTTKVLQTFVHPATGFYRVQTLDGWIEATVEHPFFCR